MLIRSLLSFCLLVITGPAMSIEEPKYKVIKSFESFELRSYEPMIIAETFVRGDISEATRAGFKIIADYIFGNNLSSTNASESIEMTVPVTIKQSSEKIDMTAPVSLEKNNNSWRVHFVMPNQYTLDTLPTPNNKAVSLRQIPSQNIAVVGFSGFTGKEKTAAKTAELTEWLTMQNINASGAPQLARYNPPWSLPFLRRNEILIPY
jgi:hypothetical protein